MMDAIIEVVPAGKPAMKAVFVQVKNSCSGVEFTTLHSFVIDSLDAFGSFIANDASKCFTTRGKNASYTCCWFSAEFFIVHNHSRIMEVSLIIIFDSPPT